MSDELLRLVIVGKDDALSSRPGCLESFDLEHSQRLSIDWFGRQLNHPLVFHLSLSDNFFSIKAMRRSPARAVDGLLLPGTISSKGFVEGLWLGDVVEVFFGLPGERYLELNLSPDGRWWAQRFKSYRDRAEEEPILDEEKLLVKTTFENKGGDWKVSGCFPRAWLELGNETEIRMNVCAIFGEEPRSFCSFHPPSQKEPDFHLSVLRKPVVLGVKGDF